MTPFASAVGAILTGTATAQFTGNMVAAIAVFIATFAAMALAGRLIARPAS